MRMGATQRAASRNLRRRAAWRHRKNSTSLIAWRKSP